MRDIAALPLEVLANVVAKLPPCEAVQLQRVSRNFRRAAAAGDELANDLVKQLLKVLTADGQSGPALLAACAARRWLAYNATQVVLLRRSQIETAALACTRLVSYLPALELVELCLTEPLTSGDLGCLLEALAWCPRLGALGFYTMPYEGKVLPQDFPDVPALIQQRGLSSLALNFRREIFAFAGVMGAVVSLTGLTDLKLTSLQPAVVPAALGRLKQLRAVCFCGFNPAAFEPGCLDLPNLQSMKVCHCWVQHADGLPCVTALLSLTRIECSGGMGPPLFPQLLQLPCLHHMELARSGLCCGGGPLELAWLPADVGSLSSTLVHLDCSGFELPRFPLALTQLVALECLKATGNEFVELPAAITALSRLTALLLGRNSSAADPLQLLMKRRFDARALGDLSGFPALCELAFDYCEAVLCESMLGATRHASLATFRFFMAYPAPECTLMVLQLRQALKLIRRGSVLRFLERDNLQPSLEDAARSPYHIFLAAMKACGL